MAQTVGQHSVAAFTSPVNGDPLNATVVVANDNSTRSAYVDHDSDTGIHVQSSLLAARPAASTAGRKWMTTDTGSVKLWFDTGVAWEEIAYVPSVGGNAATATALQTSRNINGVAFNGTADITVTAVAGAGTLTGATLASNVLASSLTSVGTLTSLGVTGTATAGSFTGAGTGLTGTASSLTTGGNAVLGANTFTAAQEWATGTAIASAATINLNTATGNRVHITGTTAITAVTLTRGPRTVIFDGILTLTHNATTNNLPGAANITTAANDRAVYESDGTTVYCRSYTKANGQAVVAATAGFTLGTPVAASGTSVTFTGIPATARQVVLTFTNLGTNGSSNLIVRLGTSAGISTSNYLCVASQIQSGVSPSNSSTTTEFLFNIGNPSSNLSGSITFTCESTSTNVWCGVGAGALTNFNLNILVAGSSTLSGALDRVSFTTVGGTDTFDSGNLNIAYI